MGLIGERVGGESSIAAVVALVLGTAHHISSQCTQGSADGCAFQTPATLMTNDATDGRAAEAAYHSAGLGVGAGGAGSEGQGRDHERREEEGFHEDWGEGLDDG